MEAIRQLFWASRPISWINTAFPFADDNGLLAAKVDFKGYYSSADTKAIQIDVTNTDTAY